MAEADGVDVHTRSKFAAVVEVAKMDGILKVCARKRWGDDFAEALAASDRAAA
jgi:hypothetical protein